MGSPLTGVWIERVLGLDMTLGLDSLSALLALPACFRRSSIDPARGVSLPRVTRVSGLSTPPAGLGGPGYRYRRAELSEFREQRALGVEGSATDPEQQRQDGQSSKRRKNHDGRSRGHVAGETE
jgi:hypothetical protein